MSNTVHDRTQLWIREAPPTIALSHPSDLESLPDAAFELARAPDGLPLVLHVRRATELRAPVMRALRDGDNPLPRDLERALAELERVARVHSVGHRIVRAGARVYYETVQPISSHLGSTLLSRMLGAVSPLVLPEDVAAAGASDRFENSALLSMAEVAPARSANIVTTPPVTFGRDARMWIGVSRDTPSVAAHRSGESTARPLIFESLLSIRSARWHVRDRDRERRSEGKLVELAAYRRALASAEQLTWSVSRMDAARLVAELARSVDRDSHARRRVHGDLKPGNVLLDETQVRAFDALDVPIGDLSAGMTEGWAAPEQILARALAPTTDVFALGLMVVSALSAVVFGEEQTVVVPAVGLGRRRMRMLKSPEVWIDPTRMELPTEARLAWRTLLMQSLAFDPALRPQRGSELANQLDELLDRWELPGRVAVACGPGRLEHLVGKPEPVWVLEESLR